MKMAFIIKFSYYSHASVRSGAISSFELIAFCKTKILMLSFVIAVMFFFNSIVKRNDLIDSSSLKSIKKRSSYITTSSSEPMGSQLLYSSSVEETKPSFYFFELCDEALEYSYESWSN